MPQARLLIRHAQLHALGEPTFEAYVERLAVHVSSVFPALRDLLRFEKGLVFLRHCVARARMLGITDRHSVALFVDLCAALGPRFDEDPRLGWITEMLELRELGASARLCLVYDRLADRCPGPPLSPEALEAQIDSLQIDGRGSGPRVSGPPRPEVPQWPERHWG